MDVLKSWNTKLPQRGNRETISSTVKEISLGSHLELLKFVSKLYPTAKGLWTEMNKKN